MTGLAIFALILVIVIVLTIAVVAGLYYTGRLDELLIERGYGDYARNPPPPFSEDGDSDYSSGDTSGGDYPDDVYPDDVYPEGDKCKDVRTSAEWAECEVGFTPGTLANIGKCKPNITDLPNKAFTLYPTECPEGYDDKGDKCVRPRDSYSPGKSCPPGYQLNSTNAWCVWKGANRSCDCYTDFTEKRAGACYLPGGVAGNTKHYRGHCLTNTTTTGLIRDDCKSGYSSNYLGNCVRSKDVIKKEKTCPEGYELKLKPGNTAKKCWAISCPDGSTSPKNQPYKCSPGDTYTREKICPPGSTLDGKFCNPEGCIEGFCGSMGKKWKEKYYGTLVEGNLNFYDEYN